MQKNIGILIAIAGLCAFSALGEIIAGYGLNNSLVPSQEADHITAANFSYTGNAGANLDFYNWSGRDCYGADEWPTSGTLDDYFSFSLAVESGYALDVTSLTFMDMRSANGPNDWTVRYSLNNVDFTTMGQGSINDSWTLTTANSSVPQDVTGNLYVRIYGATAIATSGMRFIDAVELNGTVSAVPEPGSLALLGLGGLGLWRRIRNLAR